MKIDDMKKVTQKLMQDMEQKIYIQQGSMFVSNGSSTPVQIYRTVTGPTSSSNTQILRQTLVQTSTATSVTTRPPMVLIPKAPMVQPLSTIAYSEFI